MAAFVIATGAAAAGLETTIFFTFWGLSIRKKKNSAAVSKRDLMHSRSTLRVTRQEY
jgi:peroxiredoxin family protein